MSFQKRTFTDEELILRVWDQENIRNLISRFAYYEAGNRRAEALDRFWVREPEHQKTASFGRNWGFAVGMEEVRAYYVDRCRFGAVGTALMHPLSTKLVCQAQDGQTAQGIWMGIAYETAPNSAGEPDVKWINERVAVDFVKEDGEWRIWHMFVGTNYVLSAGEDYASQPVRTKPVTHAQGGPDWYVIGSGRETEDGLLAVFDQIPDYPEREAFLNGAAPQEVYSAVYNDQIHFPPLPVEYETFDPENGYGPEGYAKFAARLEGKVCER